MEPTTVYMDAPPGKTYHYKRVRFFPGRAFIVCEEDASYLTKVLKGDGHALFKRGAPKSPDLDADGKPLPPIDAAALQAEQEKADEEESKAAQDLAGKPEEEQLEEPQKEGKPRKSRRSKQE